MGSKRAKAVVASRALALRGCDANLFHAVYRRLAEANRLDRRASVKSRMIVMPSRAQDRSAEALLAEVDRFVDQSEAWRLYDPHEERRNVDHTERYSVVFVRLPAGALGAKPVGHGWGIDLYRLRT